MLLFVPAYSALKGIAQVSGTQSSVGGTLLVQDARPGVLLVTGLLVGLEPYRPGSWRIHQGFSCSTAVGDPYVPGSSTDPWLTVRYQADARGVAQINTSLAHFSLAGINPVLGRASARKRRTKPVLARRAVF
jgi:hypothetical protein